MKSVAPDPVVAVVLSPDEGPRLFDLSEEEQVAASLLLGDTPFACAGTGDWTGFYDWLRDPDGKVIGVRQYVDDRSSVLLERSFSGVEADAKHGVVRIYFGKERTFVEATSCDQSFGDNRLLVAESKLALTFCVGQLG